MQSTDHPLDLDRYLHPFDLRQVPSYRFDVVVVGAGAAGSVAALAAADAGASVGLLAKAGTQESNTRYAQGGMAAVLSSSDSFDLHAADTLRVGRELAEPSVVESVIRAGPEAVADLIRLGTEFDTTDAGQLALSREGGHTQARIVHALGDATGREIQRAVCTAVEGHPDVTVFEELFVIDVLTDGDGHVVGVLGRTGGDSGRHELVVFQAAQVILATGGAGQVYRETTNPVIATGDGLAMGFRAGAAVRDLEFVQFHPTCLYIAGAARVLISEIVRGAGGVLRDRHGVRFMPKYHPQAELAPRDVVSRAVSARMIATDDTNVYLDLSDVSGDPHLAFPGISRICRYFRIDIARDPIPVRPGAHYMIGGMSVDLDGRTTAPGLWAVGECANTGMHGANRMGSNSLLEAIVLGRRTGRAAAAAGNTAVMGGLYSVRSDERVAPPGGVQLNIQDLTYSLKSMMWRQMGVERVQSGLEEARHNLDFWTRAVCELSPPEPRSWELINMLTFAQLATTGALLREESRGVHYRSDFKDERPESCVHTLCTPTLQGSRLIGAHFTPQPLSESIPTV